MNHIRRFRNVARVTLRDMSLKIGNHGISSIPYEINGTGELQYTPITAFVMLSSVVYPHVIFLVQGQISWMAFDKHHSGITYALAL